jgi:adenine-specific DNA-methyltransferase
MTPAAPAGLSPARRSTSIAARCVRYLRFQAQYLRRIRLPAPDSLAPALRESIGKAFRKHDFAKLDDLAVKAYGIKNLPAFDFVDTRRR